MSLRFLLFLFVAFLFLIKPIRYLIEFQRRKKKITKIVEHLPSPKMHPILGSGSLFVGKSTEQILEEANRFMSQMETPFYSWFGSILVLIIDHPDDVHAVLTSKTCMEKSELYKFFNMGNSLFTAPVNIWKPHRKALNPTFNPKILQSFVPIFNKKVKLLIRNVGEKVDKGHFDITSLMQACSLDMICETSLGVDIEAQNGKNGDYVEALGNYLEVVTKRIVNVFYHFDFIYKWSDLYKLDRKYLEEADKLPREVIRTQKQEYFREHPIGSNQDTPEIDENDNEQSYETPQIFLRHLFRLYSKGLIDDENIRDNVYLMIFAGNDTIALTLAFAVLLLAMHQDVQDRAAAEVDSVFADVEDSENLKHEHLTKLEYLEQVIRETLRLYSTAPFIIRSCSEETKIREGLTIPQDTMIVVNILTMHRRKDFWGENSDNFDPDRFSADEMKKRNPNAFAPFSMGTRNCIGMRYAYIAMKIVLANLLRHYRFKTDLKLSDVRLRYEITMKNVLGNMVQVERR